MYEPKAKTVSIKATSRVAIKVNDNFYTIEYSEERSINPDETGVNLQDERDALFNAVNDAVDEQAAEIYKTFSKKH